MNRLSEQERAGLEEVFLSISTHKESFLKDYLSHYHACYLYFLQRRMQAIKAFIIPLVEFKITLKTTTSHKNAEK